MCKLEAARIALAAALFAYDDGMRPANVTREQLWQRAVEAGRIMRAARDAKAPHVQ